MRDVNLSAIDLNLLHVVATVLRERSATKAAARLHVTQSAVSNALRRARTIFGDPLVTREPHGLAPTARGLALLEPLQAWVEEARRLVGDAPTFEPARSTRTFTIACTDAIALTLLPALVRRLRGAAPSARLRLLTLDRLLAEEPLARGECDLLIGIPPVVPPGHAAELVYRDPFACVVRRDHPGVESRLGLERFAGLPHVELALFGTSDDAIDRALARHGKSRDIVYSVPHFSTIPLVVMESDAVATLGRRVALAFAERYPLRVLTPPVKLAPMSISQVWHRRAESDPAVTFLRKVVVAAARDGLRQ